MTIPSWLLSHRISVLYLHVASDNSH